MTVLQKLAHLVRLLSAKGSSADTELVPGEAGTGT